MVGKTSIAASLLLALMLCGCLEPVRNVQDQAFPPRAQTLSLEEIGQDIVEAGVESRWAITPAGPGRLTGEFDDGKHDAVIDISYTQTGYSITLLSSRNLDQESHPEGDDINRHYNKWIRVLQRSIARRVARSASRHDGG
jgi:hypothetical protein